MKIIAIAVAVLAAGTAMPALADEGRVEVRGGAAFTNGDDDAEAVIGAAAGYDFDLADSSVFIGGEGSIDVPLANDFAAVFGLTGRIGAKLSDTDRLYATGGYSFNGIDAVHVGAGYQHRFGKTFYGKVEYRRFLENGTDVNVAVVGLGLAF